MRKQIALLGYLIVMTNCTTSHISVLNNEMIIYEVIQRDYITYYSSDVLDKRLVRQLLNEKHINLQMVNPGSMYNTTDVYVEGLPDKQLIVYGKSNENLNFILYKERGNKSNNSCIIFKKINNSFDVMFLKVESSINDIYKLKLALKNKSYTVMP